MTRGKGNRNKPRNNNGLSRDRKIIYSIWGILTGVAINPKSKDMRQIARLAVSTKLAEMGSEDVQMDLPNNIDEAIKLTLRLLGNDPNEIRNIMSESLPAEMVASVDGSSVETVKENRAQARAARKAHGFFSAEAKAAREDLRSDRKASRRERRRTAGGVGGFLKSAASGWLANAMS